MADLPDQKVGGLSHWHSSTGWLKSAYATHTKQHHEQVVGLVNGPVRSAALLHCRTCRG